MYANFTTLGYSVYGDKVLKIVLCYAGLVASVALTAAHILEYSLRADMGMEYLFHFSYCMQGRVTRLPFPKVAAIRQFIAE